VVYKKGSDLRPRSSSLFNRTTRSPQRSVNSLAILELWRPPHLRSLQASRSMSTIRAVSGKFCSAPPLRLPGDPRPRPRFIHRATSTTPSNGPFPFNFLQIPHQILESNFSFEGHLISMWFQQIIQTLSEDSNTICPPLKGNDFTDLPLSPGHPPH
jgi:hypothetical protein